MNYRLFGKTGLRVSEVALGTGTFGTAWGWGCTSEEAGEIFEAFVEAGGNFIDCADGYQNGEGEEIVGQLIGHDRDNFVVSTKYTTAAGAKSIAKTGNGLKGMMHSIEGSLRRLGTDYVDLFLVHLPDLVTSTDEILYGMELVVRQGKARYIGMSDFPAWRVSRAATKAEMLNEAPISAIQVELSLAERGSERELIPMANAFGMATMIWSPLGGGILSGKYRKQGSEGRLTKGGGPINPIDEDRLDQLLDGLDEVSQATGATPAQVAIAWVIAQETAGSTFIPVLGARRLDQLKENLAALELQLEDGHLALLDKVSAIPSGFPHELNAQEWMKDLHTGGHWNQIKNPHRNLP